jgi:transposase-like protein
MRHRRKRGRSVLLCPSCRSDRIVYDAALITGQRYHCLNCDYVGSLVLEEEIGAPPPE